MSYKIAIDGPSASGKSTIAQIIAHNNNLLFISTGFIFRSFALLLKENDMLNSNLHDQILFLNEQEIKLIDHKVFINGVDETKKLSNDEIGLISSKISSIPEIRLIFQNIQKLISENNDVVMDGRDIGTVVLPNANLKIFLIASTFKRAKRRFMEFENIHIRKNFFLIWIRLVRRDWQDRHRKISPLKKAKDSIVINSSNKTIDQVVKEIQNRIER